MIRYSYLHSDRRHVTIAREVDLENKVIRCGISVSHPNDMFRKKLGREMAVGRLLADKALSWSFGLQDEETPLQTILRYFRNPKNYDSLLGGLFVRYEKNEEIWEERVVPSCVTQMANQDWCKPLVVKLNYTIGE